jgi:hypothetical protein
MIGTIPERCGMAGQGDLLVRQVELLAALLLTASTAGGQLSAHFGNPVTVVQWLASCYVILS